MVSVATHSLADHLGIDLGATRLGVFQLFEDKTSGTFGHDESVAAGAERPACLFGLIVASGERLHGVEASHAAHADGALGSTGHDDIGLSQANLVEGISQSVGRRGAGAGRRIVGPVESEVY